MILSDSEITKRIKSWSIGFDFSPGSCLEDQLWPSSLDFRLGNTFAFYQKWSVTCIDPKNLGTLSSTIESVTVSDWDFFVLHPRQFVLWVTAETIKVPHDLVARCEWRSSLWRLGIIIHSTAWFIDPWFAWTITLEITNINEVPVKLYPGMRFGQFAFETVLWDVAVPYDNRKTSKYMNQKDPQPSKVFDDFDLQ